MSAPRPYPLLMEGALVERPWGGRRIAELKGIDAAAPIGESWEVSTHPHGLSRVANGELAGRTLAEVHELWGGSGRLPLLLKLVDLQGLASVQVHPDDGQALRLEGRAEGKCEAWYVLEAGPGAEAYLGFRPGVDRARFLGALARGTVREVLEPVTFRAGDCALLEPGTVHAAGGGILLLEVQQASDLTYRVYDWGRDRELHLDKALEVIDFAARPRVRRTGSELARSRHFRIYELGFRRSSLLAPSAALRCLTAVEGQCGLRSGATELWLRRGQTVLVPGGLQCELQAEQARLVVSESLD